MKSHWKALGVVALCCACSFGAAKVASGGVGGGCGALRAFFQGRGQRLGRLRSELNLTDAQRAKVREILMAHRSEIASVAGPIVTRGRALRDATNAKVLDEGKIRAAAGELSSAMGDAAVLAAKIKAEVRPVLTDGQAERLAAFRSDADDAVDALVDKLSAP